jgi:hypothetical protein
MRLFRIKPFLIGIVLTITLAQFTPAAAQAAKTCDWAQDSQGNWANPCPYGDVPAQTTVIDQNQNGKVDFNGDAWLFDAYADGSVNLIIAFQTQGSQVVASLFDDQNGDGRVSYSVGEKSQVLVTESKYPTVIVKAEKDWYLPDGKVNFNLSIEADGPVYAIPTYERFLDQIKTDGNIDYHIKVVDSDQNGWPDADFRYATTPLPVKWGLRRVAAVLAPGISYQDHQEAFFWPYLGMIYNVLKETSGAQVLVTNYDAKGKAYGYVQPLHNWFPPIQMDWGKSRITHIAEFAPSRSSENSYFIYSSPPYPADNSIYQSDFENPFAFYDLAQDKDGVPELMVRSEEYFASDFHFLEGTYKKPMTAIRYSWDQDNDNITEMAVKLLGNNSTNQQEVDIAGARIRSIPYDQFPSWVLSRSWLAATFVKEMKPKAYWSEGLYDWEVPRILRDNYYTGILGTNDPTNLLVETDETGKTITSSENMTTIRADTRGEYCLELNDRPVLYLSGIDHELHLKHAEAGMWNIGDQAILRYENTGGDYINVFRLEENQKLVESLYTTQTNLMLDHNGKVQIKDAPVPQSIFETLPPSNHADWVSLGEKIQKNTVDLAPDDLAKLYGQFTGPEVTIEGASIRDFRQEGRGYRFILTLLPGYRVAGSSGLNLQGLTAGEYLVNYTGVYAIQPLIPARLSVTIQAPAAAEAYQPVAVNVEASNGGSEDGSNLNLILEARHAQDSTQVFTRQIHLMEGASENITTSWQPMGSGSWALTARLEDKNGQVLASSQANILSNPGEVGTTLDVARVTSLGFLLPILGLLAAASLICALVFFILGPVGGTDR